MHVEAGTISAQTEQDIYDLMMWLDGKPIPDEIREAIDRLDLFRLRSSILAD